MATFYGSDSACTTDVGLTDLQVTSPALIIGQRIARLLQTPRGGLAVINDDADRGLDVRQFVLGKLSPSTIAQAQQQIENECKKDEQIQSASCVITLSNGVMTITLSFVSSAGPFTLTGNVSQFTAPEFFVS